MSAPVTEAHLLLAEQLIQDTKLSSIAQLIAESEAKAVLNAAKSNWSESIGFIIAERDQLRAELARLDAEKPWLKEANATVADLRAEVRAVLKIVNEQTARAESAEREVERLRSETGRIGRNGAEEYIRAERAEADTYRIKLAAIGAIEAASKYSATGNYEEADLVRQDFADKETIEVFEKFRARANRTEKAEAELAKERARLKEMAAELAHCAGYIASVRTDRQITWHEELYALQTVEWAEGAVEIAEKANAVLEAHDAAMKEDRT